MGIKERRTKILLAFGLLGGNALDFVTIDSIFLELFELSLNQKTKSTLASLERKAYIKPNSDRTAFQLTQEGFDELSQEFPYFRFFRSKWDGVWRVLSYEIPEKKRELRDRLRREVASWGLGPWHRSFWLTPHPVVPHLKQLVSGKEEQQYVQAFESSHVFGDRTVLIEKVWGKVALSERYKKLFKTWHEALSEAIEAEKKLSKVLRAFVEVLRKDPGLPRELLGDDWIGYEALELFTEIKGILLSQVKK